MHSPGHCCSKAIPPTQPKSSSVWSALHRLGPLPGGNFLAQTQAGDYQGALATSDRMPGAVRSQLNRDPAYLSALAQANMALGRKAEADRVIEQALALPFPNQGREMPVDRQMQYASLLMTAQKYEPAVQLYKQVVEEDPANIDAWRSLIAAQHQLHRDDEAIAQFGRMPQSVYDRVQNDLGFLVLIGSIYQSRQEYDRARKYLELQSPSPTDPNQASSCSLPTSTPPRAIRRRPTPSIAANSTLTPTISKRGAAH